jgi:LmbE family N-acetylglucosaminyl deacetylase
VVLHLAPHPDDELLGAPATLMALRDAGYRVVNLACGLGSGDRQTAREAELRDACRLAGFELRMAAPPGTLSGGARDLAEEELRELAIEAIAELRPRIVVSPTPHDRHPAHELVGRAVRDAISTQGPAAPRWWMWALWGPLALPTLGVRFDAARLEEILAALALHRGELERNDYRRLIEGRSLMYGSLATELLFGFGAAARPGPARLELLTELVYVESRWLLGRPRWLDADSALVEPRNTDVGEWLEEPSVSERFQLED